VKLPGLDDILRAGRQVPWDDILASVLKARQDGSAEVFDQIRANGTGNEVLHQLRRWSAQLAKHALPRWTGAMLAPAACSLCRDTHAVLGLVRCDACGQPVCLGHVFLAEDAAGICFECAAVVTKKRRPGPPPRQQPGPRRARQAQKQRDDLAAAFRVLGIMPGSGFAAVKKRYKKLVVEFSPDRPMEPAARAYYTERLKEINAAFEVLRKAHERREAA
jgi:hypothetical protein